MKTSVLQRTLVRVVVALFAIVLPLYALKVYHKSDYTDFSVYYKAAERALRSDWSSMYSLQDGASPFRYMPLTIPFFLPFGLLPLQWASMAWYLFQFTWFALGFLVIRRALMASGVSREKSTWVTAGAALFILRFCLDTFTIGQIASLMFLAFAASLLAWIEGRTTPAGAWLGIPTFVKIGPGVLYFLFPGDGLRKTIRSWLAPAGVLLASALLLGLWLGVRSEEPLAVFRDLWKGWVGIVLNDSNYYDASHYGSQSLKSMLLRGVNSGWWELVTANRLWAAATLSGVLGLFSFWFTRRPESARGRGLFFSLGLFAYLWFMPETFKYALTVLAIPVSFLLASPRSRLSIFSLVFGYLTLSFSGKDLIGDSLFFGLQQASVPLLATGFLFVAVFRLAWRESAVAPWLTNLSAMIRRSHMGPWEEDPKRATLAYSVILPIPLRAEMDKTVEARIELILENVRRSLEARAPAHLIEFLLIPYAENASDRPTAMTAAAAAIAGSAAAHDYRLIVTPGPWGRGAALRSAFLQARGRVLLVTHFDQPCDGDFFLQSFEKMDADPALDVVFANRRNENSRFRIPVKVLPLVYGRHRLGLLFNHLVKISLGIRSTDTHSGTLALTRRAAETIFALQSSPGFLSDLELFLAAQGAHLKTLELPVTIHLLEEKPLTRMLHETLSILVGLPRLARRQRLGLYRPRTVNFSALAVTADDWGLSPAVNAGILELARLGVIRRVSLLSDSKYLEYRLAELRTVPGVSVGLHFNLTYGKRHSSPGRFLLEWLFHRDRMRTEVRGELSAQLEKLATRGVRPEYIDGHHHIHVLPGMIATIEAELRTQEISETRLPYDPALWGSPRTPLLVFSMLSHDDIRAAGLKTRAFSYPGAEALEDPQSLARILSLQAPGTEVIVHPANAADGTLYEYPDPYVEGRATEYRTLRQIRNVSAQQQETTR